MICGLTSRRKVEILKHIRCEHSEYLPKKDEDLISNFIKDDIVITLRNGTIVKGRLENFSETYLYIKDARIEGKRFIVEIEGS